MKWNCKIPRPIHFSNVLPYLQTSSNETIPSRASQFLLLTLQSCRARGEGERRDGRGTRFACLKHRLYFSRLCRSRVMVESAREAGNFPARNPVNRAGNPAPMRPIFARYLWACTGSGCRDGWTRRGAISRPRYGYLRGTGDRLRRVSRASNSSRFRASYSQLLRAASDSKRQIRPPGLAREKKKNRLDSPVKIGRVECARSDRARALAVN